MTAKRNPKAGKYRNFEAISQNKKPTEKIMFETTRLLNCDLVLHGDANERKNETVKKSFSKLILKVV